VLKESSAYSDRRWQNFLIDDWLFAYFEKMHVECHRRTSTVFLRVNRQTSNLTLNHDVPITASFNIDSVNQSGNWF